ncbi:MAG: SIR2 family protein, partial [Planctomycetota bacterium]
SRPTTIALGKSEEIGMWDHDSDLGQGLLGLFQSLVAKFTILFLGYSFQDPDYRKFLIRVGRMVPQSQHFALMQKNEWEKIPSSDQTLLIEEAKIQPIFYKIANSKSHDAYRCLWQFLSHLPKKVDQPLQIVNGKQAGSFYLAQERQDYLAQQNAFEKRCQGIRYLTEGLTNAIATKEYILKHCGKKLEGFKPIFFKDFCPESEEFYEAESDWVLWKYRVLNAMIERTRTLEQRLEDGCEMRILCQKDATLKEIESGDSTVIGRYEKMLRFVDNECYDVEIRLSSGYSVSRSLGSFASMIEGHGKGANIAVAYATQARSVEFTTHFFEVNSRFAEESLTRFESEWVRADNELKSRNQIYNRLEERKSEL